ncbi:3-oxoacyl-[acyl-carrier-protein] synthase III C-terminal domain-containing protein [Prolixibacter sp. SD074]|jgi:3-oxoacyl-[acyl-carrier-protein] synthase-3|uniref:3-oxoacyl-[acyl-carrier-protein] synthase III C-terminal domain-containing protein n=1 Tax=Prolixibacter sp. SD074 TaxID=2652391 RepID=UPI0012724193|nr:3-oxoacyl-[acyl-carrier-protein] synthase III C-terminal domain-containing protein [Prolixibacter sp. SD074]GET28695.1 hypothetical protein SD074_08970 [Prolixibacter sp. SD074]
MTDSLSCFDINHFFGYQLKNSQILTNIECFGNTGSASAAIVLSDNWGKFRQNDIIISVFGGGYSSGAVLLKKL